MSCHDSTQASVKMPHLGGILHPNFFQMNELITSMAAAYPTPPFEFLHHKNLELALFGGGIVSDAKKSLFVLLDGKIHNAFSLQEELKNAGFSLAGTKDEEIILAAYKAWGVKFIAKLEGEFAIAILDAVDEKLYLIRDRIGKKSLYWTQQGGYMLFSTELKGLLATGVVPQTPSPGGLASYFYFGFIPQDLTPVHGVNKLLPGFFLKLDLNGKFTIDQYFSLSRLLEEKEKESTRDIEEVLEEAIGEALKESPKVALFEHGGRGTSLIESVLSKKLGEGNFLSPKQTLDDPEKCLEDFVQVVWHLDEPLGEPLLPAIWQSAKSASQETCLFFVDAGWDEMIAIDPKQHAPSYPLAYRLARLPMSLRKYFILPLANLIYPKFKWRILRNIEINRDLMGYLQQIALFKGIERKIVSPKLFKHFDPEIFIERFHRLSRMKGGHDLMFYFNAKTKVPDSLFLQYERLSRPFSCQVMAPFLEEKVLDFAARLGVNVGSSPVGSNDFLPLDWCNSPYFREVFELLRGGYLVRQEIVSETWIRNQLGYPYLVPKIFRKLWAILVLEIWFRLYINQPIGKASLTISVDELLRG